MKNEPSLDEDEADYPERRDLINFLREKGYDQIFRLSRAYVALEYTKYKLCHYDEDALKVILLQDPGMAELPPELIWKNRHEVYITGWKFGLSKIVMELYDSFDKTKTRTVLEGKSREDWREQVESWPKSGNFIEDSICSFEPHSEEREYWLQRFKQLEEKLYQFLEEYDNTVADAKKAAKRPQMDVDKAAEVIEQLKKKYSVDSLEEFSARVKDGTIQPKSPGDFEYEDDFFLWHNADYIIKHRKVDKDKN